MAELERGSQAHFEPSISSGSANWISKTVYPLKGNRTFDVVGISFAAAPPPPPRSLSLVIPIIIYKAFVLMGQLGDCARIDSVFVIT